MCRAGDARNRKGVGNREGHLKRILAVALSECMPRAVAAKRTRFGFILRRALPESLVRVWGLDLRYRWGGGRMHTMSRCIRTGDHRTEEFAGGEQKCRGSRGGR